MSINDNPEYQDARAKLQVVRKEARAKIEEARAVARHIAQNLLGEITRALFAQHPTLESFGWTQYTPYFNDGDVCTFHAQTDELRINSEDRYENSALQEFEYVEDGQEMVAGFGGRYPRTKYKKVLNANYDPALVAAHDDAVEFLGAFDEDDLKEMFGDHKEITIHRDGTVTVDEYEHE